VQTATIRIPEAKKDLLKTIASLEKKKMNDLVVKLIDDYAERYRESLELLAIPGLLKEIRKSQREMREGKTVSLDDVRKDLERRVHPQRAKKTRASGR
jgi:hypothetical protein